MPTNDRDHVDVGRGRGRWAACGGWGCGGPWAVDGGYEKILDVRD